MRGLGRVGFEGVQFDAMSPTDLLGFAQEWRAKQAKSSDFEAVGALSARHLAKEMIVHQLASAASEEALSAEALRGNTDCGRATAGGSTLRVLDVCLNQTFELDLDPSIPAHLVEPRQNMLEQTRAMYETLLLNAEFALEIGGPTTWWGPETYEMLRKCDNVVLQDPNYCARAECQSETGSFASESSVHFTTFRLHDANEPGKYGYHLVQLNFTSDGSGGLAQVARAFALEHGMPSELEAAVAAELERQVEHDRAMDRALRHHDAAARRAAAPPATPFSAGGRVLGRTLFRDGAATGLPSESYDVLLSSHNLEVLWNFFGFFPCARPLLCLCLSL